MVGLMMKTVNAMKPIATIGDPQLRRSPRMRSASQGAGQNRRPRKSERKEDPRALEPRLPRVLHSRVAPRHEQQEQQQGRKPSEIKAAYGLFVTDQWLKVEAMRKDLHSIVRELEHSVNAEMRA